jgi:hypothetical protein
MTSMHPIHCILLFCKHDSFQWTEYPTIRINVKMFLRVLKSLFCYVTYFRLILICGDTDDSVSSNFGLSDILTVKIIRYHGNTWNRESVVGVATGYGLEDWGVGVRVPVGSRIFSTSSRLALGVHPTSYPVGKAAAMWSWPLTSS